ncbi:MAG: FAD-dependent oxidoreductase [Candidatus Krumholzibacteriota bacterium]|nr:FAD-dependent oxidoreductase [Candidatus Krumholzibacteriota bacterium]
MKKIKLKINGQQIETAAGKTILEVVREKGLDDIPTLCHSDELEPYGSCFLCVVEVKGRWNLVPACATRVTEGMEVETRNPRIMESRKTALELLLSNHYADCVSPCMEGCPAGVDAQGYIALSAMGNYRQAVDLIREANPLPAVCGRVCVRKCEVVCRRTDVDEPVGINAIKRFVTDAPGVYQGEPEREKPSGKTVGIVGAGPAGLTAAWFLGRRGHKPVIYESMPRSGGMLRYGIPVYRLPDEVIDAEVDYICRAGAEIRYNIRVGKDVTLDELMDRHDAVFIGTGAWTGKPMRVKGEFETEGVVSGTDFLQEKTDRKEPLSGVVVVVGGGNTAMDVARTSWRLGADKVIILYRRTKAEMPADDMEIEDALEEGIEIMELAAPVGINAEKGRLKSLRCIRMKLGEPDESGRRRPVPLEGSEFDLPCQLAVAAIGQNPVLDGLLSRGEESIEITKWNTIVTDGETMKTNLQGLFAGGDNANDGPTVVIDAISDGQKAARTIDAYLRGMEQPPRPFTVSKQFWGKPGQAELGDIPESPRHEVHLIEVESRQGNFDEVASGFDYEDNVHECDRCLSCGCVRYRDCSLRLYAEEYGVDMEKFKGYARKHKVDDRHPHIVYDPNKCVLCGRCIRTCARVLPLSAIGLVGRGFRTEMRPAMNDPLVETSCVSCGNCVDACPTAALTVKYPFPGRAALFTEDVATTCGFCSVACPITVKKFSEDRYYIGPSGQPGDYLCRFGRFGHELFIKRNRILEPVIREGNERREVTLAEARGAVTDGLKRIAGKYGPDRIAVFVSPELTNEELYLAGRIAREGLGTSNVASLSLLGTGGEAGVLDRSFGFTASTSDRKSLGEADLIICNNTSMESDHLILAIEVIEAVRRGAKLVVSNSTLDATDQQLSAAAMDPMRGRGSILWNGILQLLLDEGYFPSSLLEKIEGAAGFLSGRDFPLDKVSALSGIDPEIIQKTARLIAEARKIVFVHSPDRPQDQARGDMETLANFIVLLKAKGVEAELLLPRTLANSASLEIMGADPGFSAGRVPVEGSFPGATSHAELRALLGEGKVLGALVIGEDPMAWRQTEAWLQNVEFLAAMDWTETETTRFADVVLPASTYLETAGTRNNFEGRLVDFKRAINPPAGYSGREVLLGILKEFGLEAAADTTAEIDDILRGTLGKMLPIYSHRWGKRETPFKLRLVPVEVSTQTVSIMPPLTHGEKYKREIREIGTARFKVRD